MAWSSLSWSSGNVLTSADMTAMQANFQAIADADSGAPVISQAGIADSSIQGDKVDPAELSSNVWNIASGASYTPTTVGWVEVTVYDGLISVNDIELQFSYLSVWRACSSHKAMGFMIFDGSNIRLYNNDGVAKNIHYKAIT